jgi:hypothetical protein
MRFLTLATITYYARVLQKDFRVFNQKTELSRKMAIGSMRYAYTYLGDQFYLANSAS